MQLCKTERPKGKQKEGRGEEEAYNHGFDVWVRCCEDERRAMCIRSTASLVGRPSVRRLGLLAPPPTVINIRISTVLVPRPQGLHRCRNRKYYDPIHVQHLATPIPRPAPVGGSLSLFARTQ